jgi:uncharacterized protein (DUF1800 family)
VALRMIRGPVTSTPTAGYVSRVAAVFNHNGQGVSGDMQAVIRAVLLAAEARTDTPGSDFGKLRSPLLHHIGLFRVLGGTIPSPNQIAYVYDNMGESLLNAPSVGICSARPARHSKRSTMPPSRWALPVR